MVAFSGVLLSSHEHSRKSSKQLVATADLVDGLALHPKGARISWRQQVLVTYCERGQWMHDGILFAQVGKRGHYQDVHTEGSNAIWKVGQVRAA